MMKIIKGLRDKALKKENYIYIALSFLVLVLIIAGLAAVYHSAYNPLTKIDSVIDEDTDEAISLLVKAELNDLTVKKKISLNKNNKKLTDEEMAERLEFCKKSLKTEILGENNSLKEITKDLNLITFHEQSGVNIVWNSSRPELITDSGELIPAICEEDEYVLLCAALYLDNMEDEWRCNVKYSKDIRNLNQLELIDQELGKIEKSLNEDSGDSVEFNSGKLPSTTASGASLKWYRSADKRFFLCAFVVIIGIFFIKTQRKSKMKKIDAQRREEVEKEFPYFIDKLIMLLSAGLILREAVERIDSDYRRNCEKNDKKVLYAELSIAVRSMKQTNSAFSEELMKMSARLNVREFARMAVLMRNSLDSGLDLADKLEAESAMIWNERKNSVQKLGRTADTKLIFPLIIILGVLIVIVMAPTLMQI